MSLLQTHNLKVSFKQNKELIEVVRGINFSINSGESIAIVGESGCGKSAFAKALTSLHTQRNIKVEGSILFENTELVNASEKHLRSIRGKKIGYIFQDPLNSLNPALTIGSQLKEVASDQKAIALLELVGIKDAKARLAYYPHMLSGGQRQRVMIAMTLASNPQLIVADEPTTALDVTVQAQILELLEKIKTELGTSLILITHDLKIVASLCQKVIVMYAGQIVEEGSVEDIFYRSKHPYTVKLLQALPRIDMPKSHKLIPLNGYPPNFSSIGKGCPFAARCEHVFKMCQEKNPPLIKIDDQSSCACWLYQTNPAEQ